MKDSISPILESLLNRRTELTKNQQEIARQAGLAQTYLSRIERGAVDPRLSTIQDIARALNMEILAIPNEMVPTVRHWVSQGPDPSTMPLFAIEPD